MRKQVMVLANTTTPEETAKAAEVLARTAAGLSLDGIEIFLRFGDEYDDS